MAASQFFLRQNVGDVAVIAFLQDRILDAAVIAEMGAEFKALMDSDPRDKVTLDFGAVAYLSSAALGMLVVFHKRIASKGGQIKLTGVKPNIMEVFRFTNLHKVFDIQPSEQSDPSDAGAAGPSRNSHRR